MSTRINMHETYGKVPTIIVKKVAPQGEAPFVTFEIIAGATTVALYLHEQDITADFADMLDKAAADLGDAANDLLHTPCKSCGGAVKFDMHPTDPTQDAWRCMACGQEPEKNAG